MLVAFEGIDGTGKTTQTSLLKSWAEGLGFTVWATREPTNGPWGKKIRESSVSRRLSPDEELECFVKDRREHVRDELLPQLQKGSFVIVDRYYYSSVAYQGARGLSPERVLAVNRDFAPIPDVVFLFDLDPRVGLERIAKRGAGQDLFETLEELTKARDIFRWLSATEPHVITIDAAMSVENVHWRIVFELVRGPLFARMHELRLEIPGDDPRYELVALAQRLARDSTLPRQERARQLWHHAFRTRKGSS